MTSESPRFLCRYRTPAGFSDLILESNGEALTGLWFADSPDSRKAERGSPAEAEGAAAGSSAVLPVFAKTVRWLDVYFTGKDPGFLPAYQLPEGFSPFRLAVCRKMLRIPFGQTLCYGDIAKELAAERGLPKMSAQAVGQAVGSNPLCLIIPCHRVLGTAGKLTGYGGGLMNKVALLKLEGHDTTRFSLPKAGRFL